MTYVKDIHITGNEIRITIDLKAYCNRNHKKVVVIDTCKVEKILKDNNIQFGKCTQSTTINNTRPQHCHGTWVFEKPIANPHHKKSNSRKKRSQKKLDKSEKNVILVEQNQE